MQIDRIDEFRMSAADEAAIGGLLDAAFNTDFEGRSYFQNRHHLRLVVRDGPQIIGHIALGLRAIRMGDRLVQAAGVAEVATHPDHRGKGIASALMQAAIADAKASPADFLVLFGDQPLYAAVGFVPRPNKTQSVSMVGVRTGAPVERHGDKLMVMPLRDLAWDDTATIDLVGYPF